MKISLSKSNLEKVLSRDDTKLNLSLNITQIRLLRNLPWAKANCPENQQLFWEIFTGRSAHAHYGLWIEDVLTRGVQALEATEPLTTCPGCCSNDDDSLYPESELEHEHCATCLRDGLEEPKLPSLKHLSRCIDCGDIFPADVAELTVDGEVCPYCYYDREQEEQHQAHMLSHPDCYRS